MYRIIKGSGEAEIEVKKSRFIAAVKSCRSEEEARAFIESVRKKHYDARHNCFAFRIGDEKTVLERQSDDGEPQGTAGKPMLEILKGAGLYDVCAVVTRYFGGTLLGTGGLVRAYSDALKQALSELSEAGCLPELQEGVRVSVNCEYALVNRVKYFAEQMKLFTEAEVYLDTCRLDYLVPEAMSRELAQKVREISAGKAGAEICQRVLYFGEEKPEVYKLLEK